MEHKQMTPLLALALWALVGLLLWVLIIGGAIHWVGVLVGAL
jgi:hypothetical protein